MKYVFLFFILIVNPMFFAEAQNTTNNTTTTKVYTYGSDCEDAKNNGDDVCAKVNSDYCCLYTAVTIDGTVSTETYYCSYSPDYLEKLAEACGDACEDVDDDYEVEGYEYEMYCSNGNVLRMALAAVVLALAAFF
mmetsp:Transcript_39309/g.29029  ORF Transcript_39309/g.29029 Transcript_39309/m.29029 type:complete len:135 (+) Transcript_39309:42-446(+)